MNVEGKDIIYWILMVITYFAGISRNKYSENKNKINEIATKYAELQRNNPHEDSYPYLLLKAGILSLSKNKEILKVLILLEQRHIRSPFRSYTEIDYKNIRDTLVVFQKHENKEL